MHSVRVPRAPALTSQYECLSGRGWEPVVAWRPRQSMTSSPTRAAPRIMPTPRAAPDVAGTSALTGPTETRIESAPTTRGVDALRPCSASMLWVVCGSTTLAARGADARRPYRASRLRVACGSSGTPSSSVVCDFLIADSIAAFRPTCLCVQLSYMCVVYDCKSMYEMYLFDYNLASI